MASASQPTAHSLGIDRLPIPQRMQLVEEIWDSIAAEGQLPDTPDWHKEELDRRLTDLENNPQAGSTWEEVKSRLTRLVAGALHPAEPWLIV
jgi:putative addiction module component (TIGR02574 family)